MRTIKVKCFRFDPPHEKQGTYKVYEVPVEPQMSALDVLDYIYENIDPSLAYPRCNACNRGLCGDCNLKIDGKAQLACQCSIEGDVEIGPVSMRNHVRDLVVRR